MNRKRIISNYNLAFILLGIMIFLVFFRIVDRVNIPKSSDYMFEIKTGMSTTEIASKLYSEKVIFSADYFRLVSKFNGYSGRFKAGKHKVQNCRTINELAYKLTQNPEIPPDIKVTVIEGLNIYEIASVLKQKAKIDSVDFVALAKDSKFAKKLGVDNVTLEGYLYPDTYYLREGMNPSEVIRKMLGRFNEVVNDTIRIKARNIGLSVNQMITLASIISTEAALEKEMKIMSSVFHKRLKLKMPLDANSTVQYALQTKRRLNNSDLKNNSPYNTYIRTGLPPGPISNPGLNAINAAIEPDKTDFLYFVADGKGGHIFSKNLTQHVKAVREYMKSRDNL